MGILSAGACGENCRPDHGNLLFDLESVRELKLPQEHTGTSPNAKVVNLALQGGGSHGAFTWGVLDRLLEEKRLSFEGISATSAGAVNAVVLADGLAADNKLIEQGRMSGGKRMLVHVIEAEEVIRTFSWTSRLNADWDFLLNLHDMGRRRATRWLEANFDRVGMESTVELDTKYF